MFIEQKGTKGNNFWPGRGGESAVAIVDHCMSHGSNGVRGNLESVGSYFSNSASEVSAHFGVAKDGRVWQWVNLLNTAWANGVLKKPDPAVLWVVDAARRQVNPNRLTVSIEHEGDTNDVMTEPQFQATLQLHRFIIAATGIKPDTQHIIKHSQIDSVTRSGCPGSFFPMARLLKELNRGVIMADVTKIAGVKSNPAFNHFWLSNGATPIFGLPVTENVPAGGKFNAAVEVQWFERARFELQPGGQVWLGLVGVEALQSGQENGG